jgi:molybdopterin converting factor small subunit
LLKTVTVRYFAALREAAGKEVEVVETSASSLGELYAELAGHYHFGLGESQVKAARNLVIEKLDAEFVDGDEIVYLPPVAGG